MTDGKPSPVIMKELTNGSASAEPPETDLDYYARPENYGGSSLHTLQKFILARDKQQKSRKKSKNKKNRKEEDELIRRYRHILTFDESLNLSSSSSSSDDSEEEGRGGKAERTRDNPAANANGGHHSHARRQTSSSRPPPNGVSLAVAEAHRPLSDGRRTSFQSEDAAFPQDRRRSASANEDVKSSSLRITYDNVSEAGCDGVCPPNVGSPQPGDTATDSDLNLASNSDPTLTSSSGVTFSPDDDEYTADNTALLSNNRRARALVKNRFAGLSAEVRSSQVRRKFSQAIKAVMSIKRLAAVMIKKSEEPSAMLKTFTDIIDSEHNFSENLKNQGLSFDPSYFRANKENLKNQGLSFDPSYLRANNEISLSSEVKHILNCPPVTRSQDQIQTAMYGLQCLPSFAEYPLHMQEKLAKVAWYEVVSPKRTIIRQGHYAENFYFILSGQAVVTILIRDPKTNESQVRTANFMRKGTSFGELALLHHSRRTATVTSQDTVQLLSIGREDFFDIFMSRQGDEVPEHIKFISQLDFMRGWPLDRLLQHPEHCLLHFFKRNMVIVKDSKQSEWLYIVKSGSCQVLKQLQGVTARLGIRKHETTLDEIYHLPHTGTSVRGPKVDTGLHRPRPKSNRSQRSTEEDEYFHLWGTSGTGRKSKVSSRSSVKSPVFGASTNGKGAKDVRKFSKESYSDKPMTGQPHLENKNYPRSTSPRIPRLRLNGARKQRPSSDSPTGTNGTKPLPSPGSDVGRPPGTPPAVFVRVSTLKPKDSFGLEEVKFPHDLDMHQTSVSLVSRGAECIMLSKDFFRRHATEMVRKNLQGLVTPFPDEHAFQDSLQTKADWDLFKSTLIVDITSPPVI